MAFVPMIAGMLMSGAGAAGAGILGMSAGMTSLVGAGIGAASTIAGGIAESQQLRGEAAIAKQNAQIERDNAGRARLDAGSAEEARRRLARVELGGMAAAIAQNGGGNALSVQQSATDAELDALLVRHAGESEAFAHLTNAASGDASAANLKKQATGAVVGSVLRAGGQMLAAGGDYKTWQAGQRRAPMPISVGRRPGRGGAPTGMPARDRNSMGGRG